MFACRLRRRKRRRKKKKKKNRLVLVDEMAAVAERMEVSFLLCLAVFHFN